MAIRNRLPILAALWIVLGGTAQAAHLEFGQVLLDGSSGGPDLGRPFSVTVSPDGDHAYAAGADDDAISVFTRNASTGRLSFVEAHIDGIGGVDGLDLATSVTVSPDGNHVYAAGDNDDAIAVFSRNTSTGGLSFVGVHVDGIGGVNGLDGIRSVTVSPDGDHVYAAGANDDAISVFTRNASTGGLSFVEAHVDGFGGVDGLFGVSSVTVSPDGDHVYAAGDNDDAIAVFSRNASTGGLSFVEAHVDGFGGVDGLFGVSSVTVSPDGDHVYAAGTLDDAIAVFSRNASTGELTFVEAQEDGIAGVDGLDAALSVTASPDGNHVYAVGATDNAIVLFSTAVFEFEQLREDGVSMADGLDAASDVVVSPDGRHVYTAALGEDAVGVFSLDEQNSNLDFIEVERNNQGGVVGMDNPISLAMSGDGLDLYVAAPASSGVVHFSRDIVSGELTFEEALTSAAPGSGLAGANTVTVSPDGAHVYVGLVFENAVSAWSRDAITGALSFIEIQSESGGVVSGLSQVQDLAVSPDGLNLYAAASNNPSAAGASFSRNPTTGALSFQGEISGFGDGGSAVVVSPDGLDAYVGDALGIISYSRAPAMGALVQFYATSDGGSDDLAMTPDGLYLLGVDSAADGLFVRARDPATGDLVVAQREFDGIAGVDGLDYARAVAITPSAGHALVTGAQDDSLVLFVPEPGFALGLGSGLAALAVLARHRARSRRRWDASR